MKPNPRITSPRRRSRMNHPYHNPTSPTAGGLPSESYRDYLKALAPHVAREEHERVSAFRPCEDYVPRSRTYRDGSYGLSCETCGLVMLRWGKPEEENDS